VLPEIPGGQECAFGRGLNCGLGRRRKLLREMESHRRERAGLRAANGPTGKLTDALGVDIPPPADSEEEDSFGATLGEVLPVKKERVPRDSPKVSGRPCSLKSTVHACVGSLRGGRQLLLALENREDEERHVESKRILEM
jgi:hypothetical protein